ncbi:MAG TPA: hypothetical protein VHI78_05425, partial [Bacteroidales bacterium]|nr:hypothetical protein [Bacteroidales bacterium]
MIRFRLVAVALLWIFPYCLSGQFYLTGENPFSVKWNSIKTRNFEVIFPASLAADAVKLAGRLEFAVDSMADLRHPIRKRFPVLMQNASIYSNGMVTLAPRRMELQIMPPQDSYAQDWISQLSLHEFRHVAQLNKLDQGLSRVLSWFSGEIARGLVSAQIPSWFYEGDAVYNETRLSQSGRGRSAAFEMPLRTLLVQKDAVYSYDKAIFGSYRDFVPDAYVYGYKMTGFMRSHYDNKIWAEALSHVARHPYQIWPFSFYLKKNYGFYKKGLYLKTVDSLKRQYNREKEVIKYSKTTKIRHRKLVYTDYLHPLQWKDQIIAFRTGMDDPGSFVAIDSNGSERRLFLTGITFPGDADIYGSKLIWDEIVSDPRWVKRSYSVIKEFDILSGRIRTITHKTRYFSPDISPDGSRIAVIENDIENRNYLVILDTNGIILLKIPAEKKSLLTPEWSGMQEITLITVSDTGKQLESVNITTGEWTVHIPHTINNISDPLQFNHFILFRAESANIENIFAFDRRSGKIYKITNSAFGARFPVLTSDKEKLIYSDYASKGFDIALTEMDTSDWYAFPLTDNQVKAVVHDYKTEVTRARSFSEISHLFRFHSWL